MVACSRRSSSLSALSSASISLNTPLMRRTVGSGSGTGTCVRGASLEAEVAGFPRSSRSRAEISAFTRATSGYRSVYCVRSSVSSWRSRSRRTAAASGGTGTPDRLTMAAGPGRGWMSSASPSCRSSASRRAIASVWRSLLTRRWPPSVSRAARLVVICWGSSPMWRRVYSLTRRSRTSSRFLVSSSRARRNSAVPVAWRARTLAFSST